MEALIYILTGTASGFSAGLLGIGGGVIIVPSLIFTLNHFGIVPTENVAQLATGTSLSCIAFTSMSSIRAHSKRNSVDFKLGLKMLPLIILGVSFGGLASSYISNRFLEIFFSVFLYFISIKIFLGFKVKKNDNNFPPLKSFKILDIIITFMIGFKSGILGIGGGSITFPFLSYRQVPIRIAIGTSALVGLMITWFGSIARGLISLNNSGQILGGIHLKALLIIAPISMLMAPLGVKFSHSIDEKIVRKIFSILIFIIATKLLFT